MNTTILKHCREGEKMSSATMHRMNCHHGAATAKGELSSIAKSLLLLCALTVSFAVKAQTTLFETPFETTYNNTTLDMPYRIPALVETENATTGAKELIYFGDKRRCGMDIGWGSSASDFGSNYYRIDIVARRSTDGGQSWGTETTVQQGTASCGYGDVAVTSNWENPKEIVFFAATGSVNYGGSTRSNPIKTTRFYSNDGGNSWTTTDMTTDMYDLLPSTNDRALFFTSGRICQSKQIKVGNYYRIYSALCVYNVTTINGTTYSTSNAVVVYSDDFGATWNRLGNSYAVSGGDESKVEELPNGNVLISSRIFTSTSYDSNGRRRFNVFKYNSLPTSTNTASGSWGSYSSGIQYTGSVKPCNGEILLVPAKEEASGNSCYILLHSEPYGTTTAEGRGNVSIFWKKLDTDDLADASQYAGTSWNRYPVSTTTSAYSTMILQHDGTIAFAYEENIWGKGWGAPEESCNLRGWTELGYDLQYQNFSLYTITGKQYSYYAGEEEEDPVVETVATPAISPASGEVASGTEISISCTTDGATIYYTLDGTTPSASDGAKYTAPFPLTADATVSAIAILSGYNNSEVATATYTIKAVSGGDDDEPTTTVTKYRFKNVQTSGNVYYFKYEGETNGLKLTATESEATLYTRTVVDEANGVYNFQSEDGNYLIWTGRGMSSNTGYNSGLGYYGTYNSTYCDLTISEMVSGGNVTSSFTGTYYTIKGTRLLNGSNAEVYFVIKNGGTFDGANSPYYNSNYSSAFVIEEVEVEVEGGDVVETVAAPVISPNGGEVESGTAISISCTTDGAAIYYTTDGTTPSASNGTEYTAPFVLAADATVSAIAILDGFNDSEVATAKFTIKEEEVVEWITSIINCDKESCSASSYSTLYLDYAVELPDGVKAYRGVLNAEEATLTLYQIKTGVVPALCAVIIENTHVGSSITLTKTTTTATYTNDLKGTLVAIAGIDPSNYYVLGHTEQYHLGFYHPNSTTLAANKAYIEWSSSNARSLTIKRGDDEETTAISEMESIENAVIYNLLGQRVYHMESGKIYIVNGKKVVIK